MNDLKLSLRAAINGENFDFEALALELFQFQAKNNPVYKTWLSAIACQPSRVKKTADIRYLPIELFKSQEVRSVDGPAAQLFTSSGTTGQLNSHHFLSDTSWYESSFLRCFELFYGHPDQYVILALLPGYLERPGSSLVYMVDRLIKSSGDLHSGFFLQADSKLKAGVAHARKSGKKVFLWGVTFALLELAAQKGLALQPDDVVMETGGMKGRGRELIREELHQQLREAFGVTDIHSEYGMTELLSQAYAPSGGRFYLPPHMQLCIRDANDPFQFVTHEKTGGINVIDLANYESCAFIQTQDLGRTFPDGGFEVLGRFDHSELRGCNLLTAR